MPIASNEASLKICNCTISGKWETYFCWREVFFIFCISFTQSTNNCMFFLIFSSHGCPKRIQKLFKSVLICMVNHAKSPMGPNTDKTENNTTRCVTFWGNSLFGPLHICRISESIIHWRPKMTEDSAFNENSLDSERSSEGMFKHFKVIASPILESETTALQCFHQLLIAFNCLLF